MSKYALEINNVSKSFRLPTEQASGIKQAFINYLRGIKGYTEQRVLEDISFKVEKGDFFGIVGRNGSGKSTLLKLISQIYTPDKGDIKVNGKLVPFIELGVGFNPELTGRENVYLNGALLGFSHDEVSAMYAEIVEFAELEKFMDQKLKNYSSGMQVRLAFSIAIKSDADILVLDEVLAVGDESFQRKCFQYFAQLKKDNKTVILVTHSMDQVQQFCNKAALIDKGHRLEVGNPAEIARIYKELNSSERGIIAAGGTTKNRYFEINHLKYKSSADSLSFDFTINPLDMSGVEDTVLTFVITKDSGEMVYRYASDDSESDGIDLRSSKRVSVGFENIFPDGTFEVQLGIKKRDRSKEYAIFNSLFVFDIINIDRSEYWKPKCNIDIR